MVELRIDRVEGAANLAGYCTQHHRGKHQAPGWLLDLAPDGTHAVATPTGLVALTPPTVLRRVVPYAAAPRQPAPAPSPRSRPVS